MHIVSPLRTLVLLLLWIVSATLWAQTEEEVEYYTKEWGVGIGFHTLLSDTNSKLLAQPHASVSGLMRFVLHPRAAVKLSVAHHWAAGTTQGLHAFYPATLTQPTQQRLDYHFSGSLWDATAMYELHFLPYGYRRSYLQQYRFVPFLQIGIGGTYSTVGKTFTPHIPLGFGVKYKCAPRLNLSLDWSFRFTPSDRLEGLEAPLGIKSEAFRNKDHYGVTLLTLTYDIAPRCPTCNKAE